MKIQMELLSDVIFGNGMSVPGGEDCTVLRDADGFPYYKGGTFKGVFREELERYLLWNGCRGEEKKHTMERLLGYSGSTEIEQADKLVFSDFTLSEGVRQNVLACIGQDAPEEVLDVFSHLRTFTAISEDGMVEEGSLRSIRCVNKGVVLYSDVRCSSEDEECVKDVLGLIKFVGSMRNRGFGHVKLSVVE